MNDGLIHQWFDCSQGLQSHCQDWCDFQVPFWGLEVPSVKTKMVSKKLKQILLTAWGVTTLWEAGGVLNPIGTLHKDFCENCMSPVSLSLSNWVLSFSKHHIKAACILGVFGIWSSHGINGIHGIYSLLPFVLKVLHEWPPPREGGLWNCLVMWPCFLIWCCRVWSCAPWCS